MAEFEYLMGYARVKGEIAALKNAADTIEKLRGELNKIADIVPSTKEELSVAHDVLAYVQWAQELEAQAVAMREALREAIEAIEMLHPIMNSQEPCVIYETWQCGKEALSFSAGRDLLERLRKAEAVAEFAAQIPSSKGADPYYDALAEAVAKWRKAQEGGEQA